jgi:Transmembrane protein 33/Nucleoporin POM33
MQRVVLILNLLVFLTSLGYLLSPAIRPLIFIFSFFASLVSLLANYGVPKWNDYQNWLSKSALSPDFPFLLVSTIFLTATLGVFNIFAVILVIRKSYWYICTVLTTKKEGKISKMVDYIWQPLKRKESQIMLLCSFMEVLLGFVFIGLLFTPERQLVGLFVYWNFLRIRYSSPRTNQYHSLVWRTVDEKTMFLTNLHPLLIKAKIKIRAWFTS